MSPRSAARISTEPSRRALSACAKTGAEPATSRCTISSGGTIIALDVVLEDERLGDLGDPAARLVVEVEALAIGQHAVAHLEHLGVGLALVHGDRDRVERSDRLVGDALALEQRVHGPQPVALARGVLEPLLGGRLAHRALERALDLPVAPGQEVDHAVDPLAVVLAADVADARGLAPLDVVVEARRAASTARLGALARAEQEHLAEHLERRADSLGVAVRAEVGPVATVALAREVHPREVLVERDRDVRVRLVVAQADVEPRLVLLDEVLLGEQRLGLGVNDERLDLVDHVDEIPASPRARVREVRRHPLADRDRLADVDHLAAAVAEQVHARLVRKLAAPVGWDY